MKKKNSNNIFEEIILGRIKLFSKENYFYYFRYILLELFKNRLLFRKKILLTSKLKEKNNSSLWIIISKLIFSIKESKSENNINETILNLNPLCFHYLKKLCYEKLKILINISKTESVPVDRLLYAYLDLCNKQIKYIKSREEFYIKMKQNKNRKSPFFLKQISLLNNKLLKLNTRKISIKNIPNIKPLDYTNSYTRLFIGETDDDSIRERYFSNIFIKKQKHLQVNSYGDLSIIYLKKMYKKLFKNEEKNGMDNDMIKIIKQFETDHKKIDKEQRGNNANDERPHYMYDYNQSLLEFKLNKDKNIYNNYKKKEIKKRNKNRTKSQNIGMTSSYSKINKNRSHFNSVNFEKNKLSNSLMLSRRVIYPYKGNEKYNFMKKIKIRKIFCSNKDSSRLKNNKTIILDNKNKIQFINYLNKKDFFFS